MKWTVDYSDSEDKDADAMRDIVDYLTPKLWDQIVGLAKDENVSCRKLDFYLHFLGIRGLPVFAFIRTFRPTQYQEWYDSLEEA